MHEHRPGSAYQPPEWIRVLAQIHKKQTPVLPPTKPEANRNAVPKRAEAKNTLGNNRNNIATLALKWFVLAMSLGLIATTSLGIYMAFKFNPGKRLIWTLLVLGTILPITIILL